jgi:hypothetical protein
VSDQDLVLAAVEEAYLHRSRLEAEAEAAINMLLFLLDRRDVVAAERPG